MSDPTNAPERVIHRVLVVDDDPEFARVVAESLVDEDIAVEWTASPRQALELARAAGFSVAVVDLIMAELDGLELATELRRIDPRIEVILLTGNPDLHSAIAGLRQGLFDYLQKQSLQTPNLRRAVRAAIARAAAPARD